jgi:hypothetical protein
MKRNTPVPINEESSAIRRWLSERRRRVGDGQAINQWRSSESNPSSFASQDRLTDTRKWVSPQVPDDSRDALGNLCECSFDW